MSNPLFEHTYIALLRLACIGAVHAQTAARPDARPTPEPFERLPRGAIGREVRNRVGWKIGVVEELIENSDSGRCGALAVIATSGFLGTRDRRLAVPWSMLHPGQHDTLVLDIDRAGLARAPGFSERGWSGLSDERWLAQNQRFFHARSH